VITRTGNERLGAQFEKILTDEATKLGVGLTAVTTGMATKGSDFGSENVVFLKMPKVATVAGEGITTGFGEVWHFFDQQIQYPITVLPENTLGSTNLAQFDVLILPGGNYNRILNESALGKIKEWVRNGGRLIAIENALKALAGKEGFELKAKEDEKKKESDESKLKFMVMLNANLFQRRLLVVFIV
jgi:hypothetical protein